MTTYDNLADDFVEFLKKHFSKELRENNLKKIIEELLFTDTYKEPRFRNYYFLYYFFKEELGKDISKLSLENIKKIPLKINNLEIEDTNDLPIMISKEMLDNVSTIVVDGDNLTIALPEDLTTIRTNLFEFNRNGHIKILLPKSLEKIAPHPLIPPYGKWSATVLSKETLPDVKFIFTPKGDTVPFEVFTADADFFRTHLKAK